MFSKGKLPIVCGGEFFRGGKVAFVGSSPTVPTMENIKEFYDFYGTENCEFNKLKPFTKVVGVLSQSEHYGSLDRILGTKEEMNILKCNDYVLCGIYQNATTGYQDVYIYGVSFSIPEECFYKRDNSKLWEN